MPSFVGQSLGNATAVLTNAGFHVGKVGVMVPSPQSDASTTAAAPVAPQAGAGTSTLALEPSSGSIVVSQNPPAGSKIVSGATVNFEVR
jgi:beta-lactam-binding protein with PASTA domain